MKPIANLAGMKLMELKPQIEKASTNENLDAYSRAHLTDSNKRIEKWINSTYVMNNDNGSGGAMGRLFFGQDYLAPGQ